MEKSKFGISLPVFAVIGFLFAIFGLTVPSVLLCGFAVVFEKNNWLTKQALTALYLDLLRFGLNMGATILVGWINPISIKYGFFGEKLFTFSISSTLHSLISVFIIVLGIIGIINVFNGKDANIPVLEDLAEKTIDMVP